MCQWQEDGDVLSPSGQVLDGEKSSAEEKHGCDEQKYGQVEQFYVCYDCREDHSDRAKGDAPDKSKRYNQEAFRVTDEAEQTYNRQHDCRGDDRFGGSPDDFPGNNFFNRKRRCHHGVKCFLIIHAHEGSIGILEEGVIHDVNGKQGRCYENHVRYLGALVVDASDESAQAHPEGDKIEKWFEQGRNKADLPVLPVNSEVSLPYAYEAHGKMA